MNELECPKCGSDDVMAWAKCYFDVDYFGVTKELPSEYNTYNFYCCECDFTTNEINKFYAKGEQ